MSSIIIIKTERLLVFLNFVYVSVCCWSNKYPPGLNKIKNEISDKIKQEVTLEFFPEKKCHNLYKSQLA